jgi:hypothetical protein
VEAVTDEEWYRLRNDDPRKYAGRIDPNATSESIRKRYNRGHYWIIAVDDADVGLEHAIAQGKRP